MVTSDEPGVYADGRFGIRIENEIIVTSTRSKSTGTIVSISNLSPYMKGEELEQLVYSTREL